MSAKGRQGWANPPPVMVVTGSLDFLRHREIKKAIHGAEATGRRVLRIGVGDGNGLCEILSGGFMFNEPTLAIVESAPVKKSAKKKVEAKAESVEGGWTEEDLELVVSHGKESSSDVALVIHHEGDVGVTSFAGLVAAGLPKSRVLDFPSPKPWELKEHALKFLVAEVSRLGKTIQEPLAEAVIRQAGTDLGLLSFEALKISMLLDSEKRQEVLRTDLLGLVANFGAEDWAALKVAVGSRNAKSVIRTLQEIRSGPASDAIVKATSIVLRSIEQWLYAASLMESGLGEEETASRLKMKLYPFQQNILPAARRWGKTDLIALYRSVVAADSGVRKGHLNPWAELESALLGACQTGG